MYFHRLFDSSVADKVLEQVQATEPVKRQTVDQLRDNFKTATSKLSTKSEESEDSIVLSEKNMLLHNGRIQSQANN